MVTYTPEQPITHEIEVTFNGEQVPGSPYLCRVIDPSNTIREIPVQVKRSYKIFDLNIKGGEISEVNCFRDLLTFDFFKFLTYKNWMCPKLNLRPCGTHR